MATELSKLPTDPSVPGMGGPPQIPENIKMETTAYKNDLDSKPVIPPMADTKQMNSMVSEIQSAAKQGLTRLAEDIPQQEHQVTQDPQVIANAIPQENTTPIDYIQNHATPAEINAQLNRKKNKQSTIEFILEELKIPLVISLVYFVFQSKTFRKVLLTTQPNLFNDSNALTNNGVMIISFIFGLVLYILNRLSKNLDIV